MRILAKHLIASPNSHGTTKRISGGVLCALTWDCDSLKSLLLTVVFWLTCITKKQVEVLILCYSIEITVTTNASFLKRLREKESTLYGLGTATCI